MSTKDKSERELELELDIVESLYDGAQKPFFLPAYSRFSWYINQSQGQA